MPYKTYLLFCICLNSLISVCQNTFVPDDNFEQTLIDLGFDTPPLDDLVLTSNISGITNLDLVGKNISDLTGIEDFLALTNLDCSDNLLPSLDVSNNTNLSELYCSNNLLSSLDVTSQANLIRLWCFNNQLSNLDVTQNTGLISLRCEMNNLTSLDVSNNTILNVLVCEENKINAIDVSNITGLSRFQCGNNLISNLNIDANTNLSYLSCEQNNISSLDLQNNSRLDVLFCSFNNISSLDLSSNSNLTDLDCSNNQLCSLNLRNGNNNDFISVNFDSNPYLNCVVVDDVNGNHSGWLPNSFSGYVGRIEDCNDFIPVSFLEDFIGTSYTLPMINNGSYFTESGGNGTALNAGDVIPSSQTVYIYNENSCFSSESSFNVIIAENNYFIPKYFTPNGDGSHDIWKVVDNNNLINNITIYNRHGKLLKYLSSTSNGWDGTFNGQPLNSDSYWYVIVLNTKEILKGHFALKR
ncbi:T9SS type B sorting domain-containing protein [Flavobacteriaceae bacterium SZ-1-7]|uniref:T9SS type B sorting domain-containing protein n=1 Tax=Tamlana sedimenti TaxID=3134126 RepID=UPI00312394E6